MMRPVFGSCPFDIVSVPEKVITNFNVINVFPNPSNGNFSIRSNTQQRQRFEIYQMNGALLKSEEWTSQAEVDMSLFPDGMYLIRVINLENLSSSTHKHIIQR
jgi:hypothetical protein